MRLWTVTDPADLARGYGFTGPLTEPVIVDVPYDVAMPRHLTDPPTEGPDE